MSNPVMDTSRFGDQPGPDPRPEQADVATAESGLYKTAMLIEATDAHFAALIAGEPPGGLAVAEGGVEAPEVLAMLRGLSAEVGESFQPNAWLIVEEGEVVGLTSLVRTPYVGDTVMIGYGVAASRRRRGIAT